MDFYGLIPVNPSNTETNNVLSTIEKQANKSETNSGLIEIIIEKRD